MSRRRSTIKGVASFKRLLRRLPDSANKKVIDFLNAAGPPLRAKMQAQIPVLATPRPNRTPGAARNSITFKVTPKTLNLKVGELSKRDIVFYAHILDVGRKAQTVNVTRTARRGGGPPYPMLVSALLPRHILSKTRVAFRADSLPGYRTLMDEILRDASQGVGDD